MPVRLIISPFAELDLIEIKSWYSVESINLFNEFISEFEHLVFLISQNPKEFPVISKRYRKAILKRFPYKIIYSTEKEVVVIVAVIHHKRHPNIWKSRVL